LHEIWHCKECLQACDGRADECRRVAESQLMGGMVWGIGMAWTGQTRMNNKNT
jgi:hypothetical protein